MFASSFGNEEGGIGSPGMSAKIKKKKKEEKENLTELRTRMQVSVCVYIYIYVCVLGEGAAHSFLSVCLSSMDMWLDTGPFITKLASPALSPTPLSISYPPHT